MASYLIYIPGVQGAKNDHLEKLGLASLCVDSSPEWMDVLQHDPDGGHGLVACWRRAEDSNPSFGVQDSQDWTASPPDPDLKLDAGAYWIGIERDRPVVPADLENTNRHYSAEVLLCDGNWWAIPIASRLPHRHGLNHHTGEKYRRVAPQYEDFWNYSEKYAAQILAEMDAVEIIKQRRPNMSDEELTTQVPLEDVWDYCVYELSLNYRISQSIVDRLDLFDDATMVKTVFATIDMAEILNFENDQKKTDTVFATVGSNMKSGEED